MQSHTSSTTDTPPQPQLTKALMHDLLDPSLSILHICDYHNLTLNQLEALLDSEDYKTTRRCFNNIASARDELITTDAEPRARAALAAITRQPMEDHRQTESIRKAASKITTFKDPARKHKRKQGPTPDPENASSFAEAPPLEGFELLDLPFQITMLDFYDLAFPHTDPLLTPVPMHAPAVPQLVPERDHDPTPIPDPHAAAIRDRIKHPRGLPIPTIRIHNRPSTNNPLPADLIHAAGRNHPLGRSIILNIERTCKSLNNLNLTRLTHPSQLPSPFTNTPWSLKPQPQPPPAFEHLIEYPMPPIVPDHAIGPETAEPSGQKNASPIGARQKETSCGPVLIDAEACRQPAVPASQDLPKPPMAKARPKRGDYRLPDPHHPHPDTRSHEAAASCPRARKDPL